MRGIGTDESDWEGAGISGPSTAGGGDGGEAAAEGRFDGPHQSGRRGGGREDLAFGASSLAGGCAAAAGRRGRSGGFRDGGGGEEKVERDRLLLEGACADVAGGAYEEVLGQRGASGAEYRLLHGTVCVLEFHRYGHTVRCLPSGKELPRGRRPLSFGTWRRCE